MKEARARNLELAATILAIETAREAAEGESHEGAARAAQGIARVFTRLHDVMSALIGSAGYRAFLVRAIDLSKRDHDWLADLGVSAPALRMEPLREQVALVGPEPAVRGAAVLLGTLLDLLGAFIGEELTGRRIDQAWPGVRSSGARSLPPQEKT